MTRRPGACTTPRRFTEAPHPRKPAGDFVLDGGADGGKSEGVLLSKVAHRNSSHTITQV